MHMRMVAVGDRQPGWVDAAYADYAGRLPRSWRFALRTLATSRRRRGDPGDARSDEGARILKELRDGERAVMLDERGTHLVEAFLDTFCDANLTLASQQFDRTHLAHVHAHGIGRATELTIDGGKCSSGFVGGILIVCNRGIGQHE